MSMEQCGKLVDKLNLLELEALDSYIALVDMGFVWRLATHLLKIERRITTHTFHGVIMSTRFLSCSFSTSKSVNDHLLE